MSGSTSFGLAVLLLALVGLSLLTASPLVARLRVPLPVVVLAAAAVAVKELSGVQAMSVSTADRVVTVALVCLLFNGGMTIGWPRFRAAAAPVSLAGVAGTFLTAGAGAVLLHSFWGLSWYTSALVATAIAPTDPAVVFSVLGRHRVEGRTKTILEGESGANDPVGIALMAGLIGAGSLSPSGLVHVGGTFLLQIVVGTAVGLAGGRALLEFMRRVSLPAEGLYPLRTLAAAFALYGLATVAHGSGFLAVFVAGIVVGGERAPFKHEIERFHDAVASLAEIVAFLVLGLTVNLDVLARGDVWVPGLLVGLALALVIRPLVVGACLLSARLRPNELGFVLFAGLKGAVPILLGGYLIGARIAQAQRLYGVVIVVVVFSALVQGGLVGTAARLLRLPVRLFEPEPWSHIVRLRTDPHNIHQLTVAAGAPADGAELAALHELPDDAWVALLVRGGALLPARGDTQLRAGDSITVIAPVAELEGLAQIFARPGPERPGPRP